MLQDLMRFLYYQVALENILLLVVVAAVGFRLILLPLDYDSYKRNKKLKEMQPKLKEAQQIKDMKAQTEKLSRVYREAGVNPLSMLGSVVVQLVLLITFWGGLTEFIKVNSTINFLVFGVDLSQPSIVLTVPFILLFLVQMKQQPSPQMNPMMMAFLAAFSFFILSQLQAVILIYLFVFSLGGVIENYFFSRL